MPTGRVEHPYDAPNTPRHVLVTVVTHVTDTFLNYVRADIGNFHRIYNNISSLIIFQPFG